MTHKAFQRCSSFCSVC